MSTLHLRSKLLILLVWTLTVAGLFVYGYSSVQAGLISSQELMAYGPIAIPVFTLAGLSPFVGFYLMFRSKD